MTVRNPWDVAASLDAQALGALAWAPPQVPLFPPPPPDDDPGPRPFAPKE